jgi:6-phosphogluconolactonase/glucosamine-6-phosphate isomerase/deaminase
MNYIHSLDIEAVTKYLAETISSHLAAGETVLWILSGGSGGKVCIEVSKRLTGPLTKLVTTLSDERYVAVGDQDENWQQLIDGGFSVPGALTYRPLQGKDRAETAADLGVWMQQQFPLADFKIGIFGMGTDGHTAGIKPGTSAVEALGWATDFSGTDFERITMTFDAIKQLDEVVIQAMGADKTAVLDAFINQDIPIALQPVQVLKLIDKSTLFTDYKENTL